MVEPHEPTPPGEPGQGTEPEVLGIGLPAVAVLVAFLLTVLVATKSEPVSWADASRLGFHDGPGTTALIKSSTWLWQPFEPSMRTKIRARFDMPAGMEAATSWRVDEAGVHHLDRTAYGMRSFVMLGRVTHVRFEAAEARFGDPGWRLRTSRDASPNLRRAVDRLSLFLTLASLAALLVGGVGAANAVKAYMDGRARAVAILKCLGAPRHVVFRAYLMQVAVVATLAALLGAVIGGIAPMLLAGSLGEALGLRLVVGFAVGPLALAFVFGMLAAFVFALWPLAAAERLPAARLIGGAALGVSGLRPSARRIWSTSMSVFAWELPSTITRGERASRRRVMPSTLGCSAWRGRLWSMPPSHTAISRNGRSSARARGARTSPGADIGACYPREPPSLSEDRTALRLRGLRPTRSCRRKPSVSGFSRAMIGV